MLLVVLALGLLTPAVFSYDAVFWSGSEEKAGLSSVDSLLHSATVERPVVLFLAESFALADFSRLANVYSSSGTPKKSSLGGITKWLGKSKGYSGDWLSEDVEGELKELPGSEILRYRDHADDSQLPNYPVVLVEAEDLLEMDERVEDVLSVIGGKPYRALLTRKPPGARGDETSANARAKREADAEETGKTSSPSVNGTFINGSSGGCLLYLMAPVVRVSNNDKKTSAMVEITDKAKTATFQCSEDGDNTFALNWQGSFQDKDKTYTVTGLAITMTFVLKPDTYWSLKNLTIDELTFEGDNQPPSIASTTETKFEDLSLYSVLKFAYACSTTATAYAKGQGKTATYKLGVQFDHLQVQPYNGTSGVFSNNVDDCNPFFTPGTWMGIIVGLIMVLIFLFGISMITNLKTMDRFDDPKGKPLQINVKE